jgi:hypothetical protein
MIIKANVTSCNAVFTSVCVVSIHSCRAGRLAGRHASCFLQDQAFLTLVASRNIVTSFATCQACFACHSRIIRISSLLAFVDAQLSCIAIEIIQVPVTIIADCALIFI